MPHPGGRRLPRVGDGHGQRRPKRTVTSTGPNGVVEVTLTFFWLSIQPSEFLAASPKFIYHFACGEPSALLPKLPIPRRADHRAPGGRPRVLLPQMQHGVHRHIVARHTVASGEVIQPWGVGSMAPRMRRHYRTRRCLRSKTSPATAHTRARSDQPISNQRSSSYNQGHHSTPAPAKGVLPTQELGRLVLLSLERAPESSRDQCALPSCASRRATGHAPPA